MRTVVQRQTDGHGARINVDVGGYRASAGRRSSSSPGGSPRRCSRPGAPQALEPMSALDRKVVHDTVAEIDGVETSPRAKSPAAGSS